jgi:GxxExxY protein
MRETIHTKKVLKFDELSNQVIGFAIEVHRNIGPGLLESAYQKCLAHELHTAGIPFVIEHPLPVNYKGIQLDCGYRADLIVDNRLIIELKSVECLAPIHEAQLLTYMKLAGVSVGLLINFNMVYLRDGIKRMVL